MPCAPEMWRGCALRVDGPGRSGEFRFRNKRERTGWPVAEAMAFEDRSAWSLSGVEAIADRSGALYLPGERVLAVADLHFEKGSAFAAKGQFLPPYDTRATLVRLTEVIARLKPRTVIALGDSFHDLGADGRMDAGDADTLAALVRSVTEWVWIEGNHDPVPPPRFGGMITGEVSLGSLTFRHEPSGQDCEVAGHLHPCAKVAGNGRTLRARCFATDGNRAVLPSFGAFTGGLNVRDAAFAKVFGACPDAWVIGRRTVYPIAARRLLPDRR